MKQIPMLDLKREYEYMKADIDSAIQRCLDHQRWILGPEVKELEDKVAQYMNVRHCVGVSSGTDALVLSLRALAIKTKGKEYWDKSDLIITTPFTFTATGDAILRAGATPVFVDIDPHTYNIDPHKIKSCLNYITNHLLNHSTRVVGIVPVHLYGQACEMGTIMELAREHDLFVVEDVAQAFGGMWQGEKLGSIGMVGVLSFFPSKNLGGFGDGGMACTNDHELAELVRMLLRHGGKDKYNVDHIGYNARLDTLQAAILLSKIKYIDEFIELRKNIAVMYTNELFDIEELYLPINPSTTQQCNHSTMQPLNHSTTQPLNNQTTQQLNHSTTQQNEHVFHQYTVRTSNREALQAYLKDKGISTMIYYPFPLHKMKVFENRMQINGQLTYSEKATQEVFSLPMEPLQKKEDTQYVIESIREFFKG